jgi:hypothetical protein
MYQILLSIASNNTAIPKAIEHQILNHQLDWQLTSDDQILTQIDLSSLILADCSEIVPCLSIASLTPYRYQFSFTLSSDTGETANYPLAQIGENASSAEAFSHDSSQAKSEIDVLILKCKPRQVILTLKICDLTLESFHNLPWILSIAQRSSTRNETSAPEVFNGILKLELPTYSQMEVAEIGRRICSPTCVAMVLSELTKQPTLPLKIANLIYSMSYDMYGIWPAAIYAASRFGVCGLLAYFNNWDQVTKLLDQGIALIISIRYGKGEITNVALERENAEPSGHLIVINGYYDQMLYVLDPAAPTVAQVAREYQRDELTKVWLERAGIAYVLFHSR